MPRGVSHKEGSELFVLGSASDLSHLIDANLEAQLLATILVDGESAYRCAQALLSVNDFAVERHKQIYTSMASIVGREELSLPSVATALVASGKLESIGGCTGLLEVYGQAISGLSPLFAKELRKIATVRRAAEVIDKLGNKIDRNLRQVTSSDILQTVQELNAVAKSSCEGSTFEIDDLPPVEASEGSIAFIRKPELPVGSVLALTGAPGCGKSTLATAWVRDAIAVGRSCLILDKESPKHIAGDRMRRLGLKDGPMLRWYGGWKGEVPGLDAHAVISWVLATMPRPLVVVDCLAAFVRGDENSASDMRGFINQARRLADLGATPILIHHDGKGGSSRDYRGSSDFKAGVDQAFHVSNSRPGGERLDKLTLRCFKSRYGFSGSIVYRYADGRLLSDDPKVLSAQTERDPCREILKDHPGISAVEFEKKARAFGLSRASARAHLTDAAANGKICVENAPHNTKRHFLKVSEDE